MSATEKAEVLVTVTSSPTPKRKVLRELGVARSTYYRWLSGGSSEDWRMMREAAGPHGTE